jgi:putative tryptophan/tyrosine transport system substrate-binding protein
VALFDELRKFGFVENENLIVHGRGFGIKSDQIAQIATELVNAKVDVIMCGGDLLIHAAQKATDTIPILAITDDMVATGLIRSLSNPGGNTTGVSIFATELDGKRQEILIELLPNSHQMAVLADSRTTAPPQLEALQNAARARGVELSMHLVMTSDEIVAAVDAAKNAGAAALNVLATALFQANSQTIIRRVAELRLPAIYQWPEMVEGGGLLAYGPRLVQIWRQQISRQLVKLLQGIKPTDIPVEQPSNFELVINLKTAQLLNLSVPSLLLNRADMVIE